MDEKKLTETETSAPETNEAMDAVNAFEIVYQYKGVYRPAVDVTAPKAEESAVGEIVYTDVYTAKDEKEAAVSEDTIGVIAPAPAPEEEKSCFVYNEKLVRKNKRAAAAGRMPARARAFSVMSLICGVCGVVTAILLGYVGILLGIFALCFCSVARQLTTEKKVKSVVSVIGLVTGIVSVLAGAGMIALQYIALS